MQTISVSSPLKIFVHRLNPPPFFPLFQTRPWPICEIYEPGSRHQAQTPSQLFPLASSQCSITRNRERACNVMSTVTFREGSFIESLTLKHWVCWDFYLRSEVVFIINGQNFNLQWNEFEWNEKCRCLHWLAKYLHLVCFVCCNKTPGMFYNPLKYWLASHNTFINPTLTLLTRDRSLCPKSFRLPQLFCFIFK